MQTERSGLFIVIIMNIALSIGSSMSVFAMVETAFETVTNSYAVAVSLGIFVASFILRILIGVLLPDEEDYPAH